MPTSDFRSIPAVLYKVLELKPKSVLDVGVGFGKYGVLLREYLEVCQGRFHKGEWKVLIDGVEVFGRYSNPLWNVYDEVYEVDVRKFKFKRGYDVILLCDVLEHMTKAEAFRFLRRCMRRCKRVIVTTPKGLMKQGKVFENAYERHICGLTPKDFARFSDVVVDFGQVFMVVIDTKKIKKSGLK